MNARGSWRQRGNWQQMNSASGLSNVITDTLAVDGVPIDIWIPGGVRASDGNALFGPYSKATPAAPIYAMFITDTESSEAATALMITAPRASFAYIQAAAVGMLFVRGILVDRSESPTMFWEVHQAPVPYPIAGVNVGYKVLVAQALQVPQSVLQAYS